MRLSPVYIQNLQNHIDKIANNVANSVTPGFRQQLLFLEESYDTQDKNNTVARYGGMPVTDNPVLEANLYLGKRYDFSQGGLMETGNPLDMAIQGEGFFQVRTENGKLGFTRAGVFTTDRDGNLVTNLGMLLEPPVVIPGNATHLRVEQDGRIRGFLNVDPEDSNDYSGYFESEEDREKGIATFGRVYLYKFVNPDGLEMAGNNIFLPTESSGQPIEGIPGDVGYGSIQGSALERSNTDLINSFTSLIQMQRIYEMNLRITRNQHEMSELAIRMRG